MNKWLRQAKAALIPGLAGTVLLLVAAIHHSEDVWYFKFIEHIGLACIIAAIVAILFHASEFKEYFENLAASVILRREFLEGLNSDALRALRQHGATALVKKHVTNDEYDHAALTEVVDRVMFERTLPNEIVGSGVYRTNYSEVYHVKGLSASEVTTELNLDANQLDPKRIYAKRTNTVSYTVVSPDLSAKDYRIPFEFRASPIWQGAGIGKQVEFAGGQSNLDAKRRSLLHRELKNGLVEWRLKDDFVVPYVDGKAEAWYCLTEYSFEDIEPFILSSMDGPTQPKDGILASVTVEGLSTERAVKYQVWGVGGKKVRTLIPHGIQVEYKGGWFLAGHGFLFWW